MSVGDFVVFATHAADALARWQHDHFVCGCLTPDTLQVRQPGTEVRIAAGGFQRERGRGRPEGHTPLQSLLPYLAPEQSGRIHQRLDPRTDVYALGIVFYQLLTGTLPFHANDPLEWIHAHMARQPLPPHQMNTALSRQLSDIVMKMLEKPLELRYQTMAALKFDLQQCHDQWTQHGMIEPFSIGTLDSTDRLRISYKIIGRDQEIGHMKRRFAALLSGGGSEFLLISGDAGIGKSTVVAELEKEALTNGCTFVAGKCDQYKRHIPYATFADALQQLVQTLLTGSEEHVALWRERLMAVLDGNGTLLLPLIPQVRALLGEQPDMPWLPPQQAQGRFFMTLKRFICAFTRQQQPLVLFLDDLHWADPGSLAFLKYLLMDSETENLMVVGSFRDGALKPSHPLRQAVQSLQSPKASRRRLAVTELPLAPLSARAIVGLLAETLQLPDAAVLPLATLVRQKSGGNPLFALQFLRSLELQGLLWRETPAMRWQWDIDGIAAQAGSDSVIELMAEGLRRALSAPTLDLLQQCACIGQAGPLALLAQLNGMGTEQVVLGTLREAIDAGYLYLVNDGRFRFAHDRIRQTAYATLPDQRRQHLHREIARHQLAASTPEEAEEKLFDIADHLNAATTAADGLQEQALRVAINQRAGRRAKAAGAYTSASHYFAHALRAIGARGFARDHALAWSIHHDQAVSCYLSDQVPEAEHLVEDMLRNAVDRGERVQALRLRMDLLSAGARYQEAILAVQECARLFGLQLDASPTDEEVAAEELKLWQLMAGRSMDSLVDAAAMTDRDHEHLLEAMLSAVPSAFMHDTRVYHLLAINMIRITLEHGNAGASAIGFSCFAKICSLRHQYEDAGRFERVAVALAQRYGQPAHRAMVLFAVGSYLSPCTRGLRAGLEDLRESFEVANRHGLPNIACFGCYAIADRRCALGDPLVDVMQEMERHIDFIEATALKEVAVILRVWRQFVANLRGQTRHSLSLDSDGFDEAQFQRLLDTMKPNLAHFVFYALRLQMLFLRGDHASAAAAAERAAPYLFAVGSMIQSLDFLLYRGLNAAAQARALDPHAPGTAALASRHRTTLLEAWERLDMLMHHNPADYTARALLARAELARFDGKSDEAIRLYQQAIQSAHEHHFNQLTALGYELASDTYAEQGLLRFADTCLREAVTEYRRWGADGKVAQLCQRFPDAGGADDAAGSAAFAGRLDMLAVVKAAQSISGEVATVSLQETLLRIVLEQAGAQSGHLLRVKKGVPFADIMACYGDQGFEARRLESLDLESGCVPASVIRYVMRTRVPLVLGNAVADPVFAREPYFAGKPSCSVLCLPILHKQELRGLLYAENPRLQNAFSIDRIGMLELIVAQAAISLENARLYEHLQESESRMTAVMDNLPACVYMKDLEGRYLFINREVEKLFGVELERILGLTARDVFTHDVTRLNTLRETDGLVLQEGRTITLEEMVRLPAGVQREYLTVKTPLHRNGKVQGICGISMDITEQKQARANLEYLAHHDALTGLANRSLLIERLGRALANARRNERAVALLFLDLDRFKIINDSLGHWAGDMLLKQAAARIASCVREVDTVARLSGDEFVVVITDLAVPDNVHQSASKMMDSLALPFDLNGHKVRVGASIGISLSPEDAQDAENLLKHADLAMHHAKNQGRNRVEYYDPEMNRRAQERLTLEYQLRTALERGELFLLYQPQVNLNDRRVTGAEVLIRWRHPALGMVSPQKFIPIAEDCGLIFDITRWVIREACRQLQEWQMQGLQDISLAVNVSASSFLQEGLLTDVADALAVHGVNGRNLELEMTEGILMQDVEATIDKLHAFKRLGVRLSIDDFGTGYSSLSYLKRLPVDKLKIDQSFVRDVAHDTNDSAITSTIIAMAKHLKLKVIAEGVEDADAERFLHEQQCDQMQGFLFSRPVPAQAFAAMLM